MAAEKLDVLMVGPVMPLIEQGIGRAFTLHKFWDAPDREALIAKLARRLDAFHVPVVYHGRNPQPGVPYRHYADLIEMAREVDVLMVVTPGGPATKNLIDAKVLEALGPDGILINMSRGSVVDEPALIAALKTGKILSAGLDVFANEPQVPPELMEMENVV